MKNLNALYAIISLSVICSAIAMILHIPGYNAFSLIFKMSFLLAILVLSYDNAQLRKRVKELEGKRKK